MAIEPKTKLDQEKMGIALQRLSEEDPTFKVYTHEDTGQTIIAGMGSCIWKSFAIACSANQSGRERGQTADRVSRNDHDQRAGVVS